ncbi:hypothetical protein D3C73_1649910 [compost metagenome]
MTAAVPFAPITQYVSMLLPSQVQVLPLSVAGPVKVESGVPLYTVKDVWPGNKADRS